MMKLIHKMKHLIILILIFSAANSNAQLLSIHDAVDIALKNNLDLKIERYNVEISKINNNTGMAGGLPVVNMNLSDQESRIDVNQKLNSGTIISRSGAYSNMLNANITGTMLLYNGYKVVTTKKRLEEIQKQSEHLLLAKIQNTIADVMLKYYAVVREMAFENTLQQSKAVSLKQLDLVTSKKTLGLASDADVFQAQIDLNKISLEWQSQQTIVRQSKIDLADVLEFKSDSAFEITDSIVVNSVFNLDDVLRHIDKNAEIASLNNQIRVNSLIEKEVSANRKPSLRLNSGYSFGNTESTAGQLLLNRTFGPFISLGFSFPIYSGGMIKKQEQTAQINTQIALLKKEVFLKDQQTSAAKTYHSYADALNQLQTQQQTYELSQKLLTLVQQRYQLNAATALEVKEAQKSFEDASFRLLNLKYIAKIAEIELQRICNDFK